MSDGTAILAAILASPEDDTARLVYADWLQEQGEHGRAEFIRVQVAAARIEAEQGGPPFWSEMRKKHASCGGCSPWCRLLQRELRLHASRPVHPRLVCPACGGQGYHGTRRHSTQCFTCNMSGDLFLRHERNADGEFVANRLRKPVFRRGFIDSVECHLAEVGTEEVFDYQHDNGDTFQRPSFIPSTWAITIAAEVPTLTRLVAVDREPYLNVASAWIWVTQPGRSIPQSAVLPHAVYRALTGDIDVMRRGFAKAYRTAGDANDALAVALCTLARGTVPQ